MKSRSKIELTVPPELAGKRLDACVSKLAPDYSRVQIQRLIADGALLLNGNVQNVKRYIVSEGDRIAFEEPEELPMEHAEGEDIPLSVLYEDDSLLVIDKPAGMATHGKAERGDATVAAAMAARYGTDAPFHPVTRLDRGTSGLLVAAKSGYAHERLRRILHTEEFCRTYLALVCGAPPEQTGSITFPLKKDETAKKRFCVAADGLAARTDYTLLETRGGLSLLRLRLYTGRTHQIRVHLAALGCPVCGDRVYGEETPELGRPALHSAFLHLRQPVTGAVIDLGSPLPEDMEALWKHMK